MKNVIFLIICGITILIYSCDTTNNNSNLSTKDTTGYHRLREMKGLGDLIIGKTTITYVKNNYSDFYNVNNYDSVIECGINNFRIGDYPIGISLTFYKDTLYEMYIVGNQSLQIDDAFRYKYGNANRERNSDDIQNTIWENESITSTLIYFKQKDSYSMSIKTNNYKIIRNINKCIDNGEKKKNDLIYKNI